jgi:hypothetical protein
MQRKTSSKEINALLSSEVMLLAEFQPRSSKGSSNDSGALPRRSAPQRIRPNSFHLAHFPIILLADGALSGYDFPHQQSFVGCLHLISYCHAIAHAVSIT